MNGNEPAYPQALEFVPCINPSGLTKRELFASMVLQGMAASNGTDGAYYSSASSTASQAVEWADALLAELAKPTEVAHA